MNIGCLGHLIFNRSLKRRDHVSYLALHDAAIYYEVYGAGQPIVFIHGMGLSHTNWKRQVELVTQHGFQAITLDIRGHGRSTSTSSVTTSQNMIAQLTNDIYQLLEKLKLDRVTLVGYSTGTIVCQQFSISYPQRVEKLILTGAFPKISNFYVYGKFLVSMGLTFLNAKQTLVRGVARSNGKDAQQIREFEMVAKQVRRKDALRLLKSSLFFDCREEFKKLTMPILVTYGGNERHMMTYRRDYLQLSPTVEVCLFPQVNHAVLTKATKQYNDVILDFILSRPSCASNDKQSME